MGLAEVIRVHEEAHSCGSPIFSAAHLRALAACDVHQWSVLAASSSLNGPRREDYGWPASISIAAGGGVGGRFRLGTSSAVPSSHFERQRFQRHQLSLFEHGFQTFESLLQFDYPQLLSRSRTSQMTCVQCYCASASQRENHEPSRNVRNRFDAVHPASQSGDDRRCASSRATKAPCSE